MNKCDYGCGEEAKYQFKNGKWCCNKSYNSCPIYKETNKSRKRKKKIIPTIYLGIELCNFGCNEKANYQFKNGKLCCSINISYCTEIRRKKSIKLQNHFVSEETKNNISKSRIGQPSKRKGTKCTLESRTRMSISMTGKIPWNKGKKGFLIHTKETREKMSASKIGEKNHMYRKNHTKESKKKNSISNKATLEYYKKQYPTFSKVEELRYNSLNPEEREIQVHCKNHNCENSKEKGGWFTPSRSQMGQRIDCIEKENGNDGGYFYCSQHCKDTCPIYGLRNDPYKNTTKPYTDQEYQIWRQKVLKQDESTCQICGSKENLHCHHIEPVKLEPEYALDPSNGIVLCQTCHIKYGHKKGTECSHGNLAKIVCNKKGSFNENSTQAITT